MRAVTNFTGLVSQAPCCLSAGEQEKFSENDKKIVRDNLLEAIIQAPHIIRYASGAVCLGQGTL